VSLGLPGWYGGGFPDAELVVIDILQPMLNLVDVFDSNGAPVLDGGSARRPLACTFLPERYGEHLPIVRVYRGGGTADDNIMRDSAAVQVAVIADTRQESWQLLEMCRQWLLSFNRGGSVARAGGSATLVDRIEELVGPQQLPELNPDKRLVQLNFRVVCRKPRGLPDYQKIREQLP
jgi:hypothetical protein